jgi:hypothetical protein
MTPIEAAMRAQWQTLKKSYPCLSRLDELKPSDIEAEKIALQAAITAHESAQWHDLVKNPQDLPEDFGSVIAEGLYNGRYIKAEAFRSNNQWVRKGGDEFTSVTAWRELPTREGK